MLNDPARQHYLQEFVIYVIPVQNPDGHEWNAHRNLRSEDINHAFPNSTLQGALEAQATVVGLERYKNQFLNPFCGMPHQWPYDYITLTSKDMDYSEPLPGGLFMANKIQLDMVRHVNDNLPTYNVTGCQQSYSNNTTAELLNQIETPAPDGQYERAYILHYYDIPNIVYEVTGGGSVPLVALVHPSGTNIYLLQKNLYYMTMEGMKLYVADPRAVDEFPPLGQPRFPAYPNPYRRGAVRFPVPQALQAGWTSAKIPEGVLTVASLDGRVVRRISFAAAEDRSGDRGKAVLWDGKDNQGRAVPSGVYFVRLEAFSGLIQHSVVVSR